MADTSKKDLAGCLLSIVKLMTVDVAWFWLLHAVLVHVDATTLEWYVFWTYVPASVFITCVWGLIRTLFESK